MDIDEKKAAVQAILFAAGREVNIKELMVALELSSDEIMNLVESMKIEYEKVG